jgi:hypothetical protein
MYSWYDRAAIHALGFAVTMGWRIVGFGRWLVEKSAAIRDRHYPTTSS